MITYYPERRWVSFRPQARAFHALARALRACCVRHTKSQRIGGAAALALPDATTSTLAVAPSADERALCAWSARELEGRNATAFEKLVREGGKRVVVEVL